MEAQAYLMTLSVKVTGIPAALRYLGGVQRGLTDFRPVFLRTRKRYSSMVLDEFKGRGGAWGVASWVGLSPLRQYIRGRVSKGRARQPILQWTGALKRAASATAPYTEVDSGRTIFRKSESPTPISYLLQETDDRMFIGLVGPKALHQEGGQVGRYYVPARPFWPWNAQVEKELMRTWQNYITNDVFK